MVVPPYPWKIYNYNLFVLDSNVWRAALKHQKQCDVLCSWLGSQWRQGNYLKIDGENMKPDLPRWKNNQFDDEKHIFIFWFKCLLHEKITMTDFISGLYSFKCVEAYCLDLQWADYVNELYFKEDLQYKWDAFIIASFILKVIFHMETIEITNEFKVAQLDGFIHSISRRVSSLQHKFTRCK